MLTWERELSAVFKGPRLRPARCLLVSRVPTPPAKSNPNPLAELALTVVAPSLVMDYLSEPARLGPYWALVVGMLFPLAFGIWCWVHHSGWNALSGLGLITVLLSGGLGLLKLDAFWFAVKESAMPVILGLAFPLSHRWGKPLINALVMQPHILNQRAIQSALDEPAKQVAYDATLLQASWQLGVGMVLSAVANFFLALWLLAGKEPGTPSFVKGVGTLNWASTLVVGAMLVIIMLVVMVAFLRKIQAITGLDKDDITNPGRTVRRVVTRE